MFGAQGRVSLIKVKAGNAAGVERLRAAIERRYPEASALSVFAVANTMAMSVLERAREIGILKAVGWGRGRIIGLFLGESLVLGAAGGVVGVGLGALALGLAVGTVGGLLPSWRAARLDPVQALRQV